MQITFAPDLYNDFLPLSQHFRKKMCEGKDEE